MPITKEFTIRLEDRPGTLGKLYQTLAEQDVNILANQQFPHEKGKGSVRLIVDNPDKTRTTLDRQRADYGETAIVKAMVPNRLFDIRATLRCRCIPRTGANGVYSSVRKMQTRPE